MALHFSQVEFISVYWRHAGASAESPSSIDCVARIIRLRHRSNAENACVVLLDRDYGDMALRRCETSRVAVPPVVHHVSRHNVACAITYCLQMRRMPCLALRRGK